MSTGGKQWHATPKELVQDAAYQSHAQTGPRAEYQ